MSAVQKVLGIPELFEAILLQLPMKSLLMAQKISKHWRATIKASKSIQKTLFLLEAQRADQASTDAYTFDCVLDCEHGEFKQVVAVNPVLCRRVPADKSSEIQAPTFEVDLKAIDYHCSDFRLLTQPVVTVDISFGYRCSWTGTQTGHTLLVEPDYELLMSLLVDECETGNTADPNMIDAGVYYFDEVEEITWVRFTVASWAGSYA